MQAEIKSWLGVVLSLVFPNNLWYGPVYFYGKLSCLFPYQGLSGSNFVL